MELINIVTKAFLKIDETLMEYGDKLSYALIYNSYLNEESCSSTVKIRKIKVSHLLETSHINANKYYVKKGLHCKI